MLVEQREIARMQVQMENNEGISPEILPAEKVRVLIPYDPEVAHYNAAVIRSRKNPSDLLILLREVSRATVKSGIPDKGNLLIYRSTPEKVEKIGQLDLSDPTVIGWEDVRAFSSDETVVDDQGIESERVLLGLTAIRASDNKPVAATVRGEVIDGNFFVEQGSLLVYLDDEGKNVTPISLTESLFRREGSSHSLEVVEHSKDENGRNKLRVKKTIQFPQKPWCEWRIGTQAQILPGGILPIHGVNRFSLGIDSKTGEEVYGYTYSMGLAQLDEDLNVVKITDTPLFTRESFRNILPTGTELNTNKNVIYCCGYSVEGDMVKFVINIGDLMTVEVSKSLFELRRALDKSSPIVSKEMIDKAAA
ncbi:MAG: hypothetical protein A2186_00415 [Candidatus Levybacteria bacterium RIFOXYA1_FULL_41_10]|nr:MAG: hypothetical protein UT44_C0020G0014 [Candidatus Levybacteria bacterium GW2011_GWA1_39_32]KKR50912.1 MAG: hypothetical protein UT87_C0010G0014 [Candidatus Levybacteria bacterium GW2011_GWC1_40_19]KKR73164.1 MAG: hypothetical protein UU15_C0017G0003 [Candidatus Levybacteria bacterium GW2011_GWC2_40_7]KKR94064.1 MAG: hypothetical protein UU45_C0017G0013 [Candidatus Levybacteria bacterium GW2011_GWA2_41_15]KKS01185.1 MAG: hypothetical protein UU52_C0017G0013 [Candidatus Levybacteria bacter